MYKQQVRLEPETVDGRFYGRADVGDGDRVAVVDLRDCADD